ncbi:hypothetical protein BDN72DRAFT_872269 [Pluteus cervinus]|uniref:Uncharacterized protein n=1 Tax=Pluteus cervinus TaxID=181527 RepID=A0ACD3AD50_9AGAR|nr:hypothetical protein BDN72DRAFT_872269 [Pluteus cervinus]
MADNGGNANPNGGNNNNPQQGGGNTGNAGNAGNGNAGNAGNAGNGNGNTGNNGNTNNGNGNTGNNGNNANGNGNASSQASSSSSGLFIPATAAAGGLTITQPPQTATSFYKIAPSQVITFGWNMTSVIATPTHLTVSAVCDNGNTYPVGPTDGVIAGTATGVTWNPFEWNQAHPELPLVQGNYQLTIWDDRGPNAARKGGFLVPNSALKFALYTTQPYTGLSDGWSCTTCSGALGSAATHPVVVGSVVMMMVMFLSGWSVIRSALRVH